MSLSSRRDRPALTLRRTPPAEELLGPRSSPEGGAPPAVEGRPRSAADEEEDEDGATATADTGLGGRLCRKAVGFSWLSDKMLLPICDTALRYMGLDGGDPLLPALLSSPREVLRKSVVLVCAPAFSSMEAIHALLALGDELLTGKVLGAAAARCDANS